VPRQIKISVDGDLDLPRSFSNCAYFVNGTIKGAWCAFEDTIQSGMAYELSPLMVTVLPQAKAELLDAVGFEWYGREYGADLGGIAGLAEREGAPGTKPVKGPGTLRLVKSKRLVPRVGPSFGFVNLTLVQGPPGKPPRTAKPSMTPTTRPAVTPATKPTTQPDTGSTTTPTDPAPTGADAPAAAPPAPPPTDLPSGSVGPLAFTGSKTAAVGGAGIFLIGAGLFVAVLMRRRGTKFVA
jgi:hypothetical protein